MSAQLWAFLGISVLVIVTPGPDTALTVRNTLVGGRRGGIFTAMGVATGQAVWAFATSVGVIALIVASEPLFQAIKFAGAAYLVVLGAQTLYHAARPGEARRSAVAAGARRTLGGRAAFRQGVLNDLGNPKMAAFFTSLLPQFATGNHGSFAGLMELGLLFALMTLAWLAVYAVVVARAREFLRRPRIRRAIEAVTGAVLIALGLRIAAEHR